MSEVTTPAFGIYDMAALQSTKLVERISRTLRKRGAMTTGRLAQYVRCSVQEERFQATLTFMVESGLIELAKRPWGIAHLAQLKVENTGLGSYLSSERDETKKG